MAKKHNFAPYAMEFLFPTMGDLRLTRNIDRGTVAFEKRPLSQIPAEIKTVQNH